MSKNLMVTRQLKALARWLGAVAMLSLYAIGSTQTGYLHQLFHPDEVAATHSPQLEEDPCHRALYHGMDIGCRHKVHLVKVHSCGLCHMLVHSDLLLFETPASTPTHTGREIIARLKNCCTIDVTRNFHTRGPPVELHA
ncbi:MAG TPA: hypothetical protein VK658_20745 [Chryseolinea sp.]|nr:hypothetical protein [Chryseolinea sp.]